ncbi:MAG: cyclic nucleotide-binding domain-containing protein [Candidatus Zixiibacteriota bacterium]|nr:MAG: cyclic nucleotide-binding domain-containing protein [candidate division Zixibacteria bacterium]
MRINNLSSTNPALDLVLIRLAEEYSLLKAYQPGETIFTEGEPGSTMLLILRGTVRVLKQGSEKIAPRLIAMRGPGDFLGEMALVEESPRFATLVAGTECEVLEFSRENFEKVISEQPALATRVLRSLSSKLRESDSSRLAELEENNRLLTTTNEELIRLNSFLDCVIDQSPSAILLATRTGDIFRMNKATARMFEIRDPDEDINITYLFSDFEYFEDTYRETESWHGEVTGVRNGEKFPVYLSVTSMSGHGDNHLHLIICQDISELKLLNQTIVDIEKYESAQETASELAHDLKNYLGVLIGNVELALTRLSDEQKIQLKNSFQAISDSSKQIVQFVENMMIYRDDKSEFRSVNLPAVVNAVWRFCRSQVTFQTIKFDYEVAPDFPALISVKEDQMRRVMVNLLVNAAEALSQTDVGEEKHIIVRLENAPETDSVIIKVSDNGPGIASEHVPKLFRERFTTKRGGHGIGLMSVAKIIQAHGGKIKIDSNLGQGTTFEMSLPSRRENPDD